MAESRSDKFKRIAEYRTNAILEKIRLLGNLSNRSNYDYTEEDLSKIFSAIEAQLRTAKALFNRKRKRKFEL